MSGGLGINPRLAIRRKLTLALGAVWSVPQVPVPQGPVSYVTNNNVSGVGSFAQALVDRAAGGVIAIDPALTLDAQTLTANPSDVLWITSGTSGAGLVYQPLPAINYPRSSRATLRSLSFNGTASDINNVRAVSVNFGDDTYYGHGNQSADGLVWNIGPATYVPSIHLYHCEFFGPPLRVKGIAPEYTSWSMRIKVKADNSWFSANAVEGVTQLKGAVSGVTCMYASHDVDPVATVDGNGVSEAHGILVYNISAPLMGSTGANSGSWDDFIGPFAYDEDLQYWDGGTWVNTGATYTAPYLELTVNSNTSVAVGDVITGKTSLATGVVINKVSTTKILLKNVYAADGTTRPRVSNLRFTATEALSKTGAGGATVATNSAVIRDNANVQTPILTSGVRGAWRNYTSQGCYFHNLERGESIGIGSMPTGQTVSDGIITIIDNDYDSFYRSGCYASGAVTPPARTLRAFNRTTRHCGQHLEPSNPHAGDITFYSSSNPEILYDWTEIYDMANVSVFGYTDGAPYHAYQNSYDSIAPYTKLIESCILGNVTFDFNGNGGAQALLNNCAQNNLVIGNVLAKSNPDTGLATGYLGISIYDKRGVGTGGNVVMYNATTSNIAHSPDSSVDSNGNITLGQSSAAHSLVFNAEYPIATPVWTTLADRGNVIATAIASSRYQSNPVQNLIDWSRKSINVFDVGMLMLSTTADADQGQVLTSHPRKYWGLQPTSVAIDNGRYKKAATKSALSEAAFTALPGTVAPGEWLVTENTAASEPAAYSTTNLTVGARQNQFSSITKTARPYRRSYNNGVSANTGGYAVVSVASAPTLDRAIIAARMSLSSNLASSVLWGDYMAGSIFNCSVAGTALRFKIGGSAVAMFDWLGGATALLAGPKTMILSIDLSTVEKRETLSDAVTLIVDGQVIAPSGVVWTKPATVPFNVNALGILAAGRPTSYLATDGSVEFFWADWGLSSSGFSIPDIKDPGVQVKFMKELLGATGAAVTGAAPKVFLTGNAAYWNGPSIINAGTIGNFTKYGAQAFTDVPRAPVISNVVATPAAGIVTVTFTTDIVCTSKVDYGPTVGYGSTVTSGPALTTSHSLELPLLPSGTYHFSLTAYNEYGDTAITADNTVAI